MFLISSFDSHEDPCEGGTSIFYILLIKKLNSRGIVNSLRLLSCKWWRWDLNPGCLNHSLCYIKSNTVLSHLMLEILGNRYYHPLFIVPALYCCKTILGLKPRVPLACESWRNWSSSLMVCDWEMWTALYALKTIKHCWRKLKKI